MHVLHNHLPVFFDSIEVTGVKNKSKFLFISLDATFCIFLMITSFMTGRIVQSILELIQFAVCGFNIHVHGHKVLGYRKEDD